MPLLSWENKYSVNNNQLDGHHKTLFDIFNRLYDICMIPDNAHRVDQIIDELISYTNYHFSAEQQYMRDIGYMDIYSHILLHQGFKQKIIYLKQVGNNNVPRATRELIAFLGKWLLNHVVTEDNKYSI